MSSIVASVSPKAISPTSSSRSIAPIPRSNVLQVWGLAWRFAKRPSKRREGRFRPGHVTAAARISGSRSLSAQMHSSPDPPNAGKPRTLALDSGHVGVCRNYVSLTVNVDAPHCNRVILLPAILRRQYCPRRDRSLALPHARQQVVQLTRILPEPYRFPASTYDVGTPVPGGLSEGIVDLDEYAAVQLADIRRGGARKERFHKELFVLPEQHSHALPVTYVVQYGQVPSREKVRNS